MNEPTSRLFFISLEHLSCSPPPPGASQAPLFTTSGPKKSQQAQNELYHRPSWSPCNLSAISVCPCMRFIIALAVCLSLTCLPEACVKCVWPKKPPCGCVPLCPLAAGVGQAPANTRHLPASWRCFLRGVRMKEGQAKITELSRTHAHTKDHFSTNTLISLTVLTPFCSSTRSNCWGWRKRARKRMTNAGDSAQP